MYQHHSVLRRPTQSYWIASTATTSYPALTEDIEVDVAVIGGGIAGVSCAYFLRNEGLKVALVEANRIAQGVTGHTTAKISSQHRLIYSHIKEKMGLQRARQYADANQRAIRVIEENIDASAIDCDYVRLPAYVYTQQGETVATIEDEVNTALELGIEASFVETIDELPFPIKAAVRFEGQAQFHPCKYLLALAEKFVAEGGLIFEQSRIMRFDEDNRHRLTTGEGKTLTAATIVMATNCPVDGRAIPYAVKLYPSRSYIIAVETEETLRGGMYLRAEYPGRSLRSQVSHDGEMILIGGENHKTGQGVDTTEHFKNLIDFAHEHFRVKDIPYRWSTQDYKTVDGVPYIGYYSAGTPNKYVATGFGKWGMTNGTAAALIIRDLIVKGESAWQEVYDPARKTIRASAKKFMAESLNVSGVIVKEKVAHWRKEIDLERGHGGVFSPNGKRIGAYRDEQGQLHMVDTTCTHLGCQLNWNSAEKSWDCPCHGGRFTYTGEVIQGPVTKPLRVIESKERES